MLPCQTDLGDHGSSVFAIGAEIERNGGSHSFQGLNTLVLSNFFLRFSEFFCNISLFSLACCGRGDIMAGDFMVLVW